MGLGREVLSHKHGKRRIVHVDAWDGDVILRQLSYAEVIAVQELATGAVDLKTQSIKDISVLNAFNFELIRHSWVNEAGEMVLGPDDGAALMDQPHEIITALVEAINEFNHLTAAAAKEVEKN